MNADRIRLSCALLISIAIHGSMTLFGDLSAGRIATAARSLPVAVTVAAYDEQQQVVEAPTLSTPQQDPRPRESDTAPFEQAESEVSVSEGVIPDPAASTESSMAESITDESSESPTQAEDTLPSPESEFDQVPSIEAVVSEPVNQLTNTSIASRQEDVDQAGTSQLIPVAETPDVRAVPLYYRIPKPTYPSRSRDLGEEGLVIIAVLVGKDGSVLEAYVSESSGYSLLDGSALATVREQWRFRPGTLRGEAIPSWVRVPINFNINSG